MASIANNAKGNKPPNMQRATNHKMLTQMLHH